MAPRRSSEPDAHEQMAEIAESPDMEPPRAEAPARPPRSTTGVCRKCGATAGEFFNAWHKITTSYFLPAHIGSYRSSVRATGQHKRASAGSSFSGW
jgi:hypothetical protein